MNKQAYWEGYAESCQAQQVDPRVLTKRAAPVEQDPATQQYWAEYAATCQAQGVDPRALTKRSFGMPDLSSLSDQQRSALIGGGIGAGVGGLGGYAMGGGRGAAAGMLGGGAMGAGLGHAYGGGGEEAPYEYQTGPGAQAALDRAKGPMSAEDQQYASSLTGEGLGTPDEMEKLRYLVAQMEANRPGQTPASRPGMQYS